MKLIFAPPYLEEGLRKALAGLPAAREQIASGEVRIAVRLQDLPSEPAARAVVVLVEPDRARNWALGREVDRGSGLVASSSILAGAAAAASLPRACLITEEALHADPAGALAGLARHLLGAESVGDWRGPNVIEGLQTEARVAAEREALAVYERLPLAPGASAWWSVELFHSSEADFPGAMDITGPARNLIFGPYVFLGPGVWEAELALEFSDDASQYDFPIDFGVLEDFTQSVARPAGPGRQVATVRHAFRAPLPAELRLSLGRAAFHGAVRLHGAKVTYVAPLAPAAAG